MRYKGQGRNWWPIILMILLTAALLAVLYVAFFMNPTPGGIDPTFTPSFTPIGTPGGETPTPAP